MENPTSDLDSSVYSLPESPVLPYFKEFPVVVGQKFTFSCLGKKTYQEALQIIPDLLGPMDTVYIHMPEDGNPLPMTALSLEELKSVVCTKLSSESQPIIAEGNLNAFNALVIEAEAGGVEVLANTKLVYDFVMVSIIENLAAKVIKSFFRITNPFTGQPMSMLCSRGLYTTDKNKRDAMEKRLKKKADNEAKAQAMMEAKRAAVEEIYSDEERSDVPCRGGKKQPSDSEDESQHESESDTTVDLNSGVADNVMSNLAAGNSGMRTHYAPVGASLSGNSLGSLPAISPLGSTLGGVFPVATRAKRSRNRAHKKHGKKSKSKKAARSAKPRKTSVVRPSKSSSSSASESSEDDEAPVNPQQV